MPPRRRFTADMLLVARATATHPMTKQKEAAALECSIPAIDKLRRELRGASEPDLEPEPKPKSEPEPEPKEPPRRPRVFTADMLDGLAGLSISQQAHRLGCNDVTILRLRQEREQNPVA